MFSITRATVKNTSSIATIGAIAVEEAHRGSCSAEDMNAFLEKNYNEMAVQEEICTEKNIYHILNYKDATIGFSKIVFNNTHSNINRDNIARLDRIYLLKEFYGLKFGFELLKFNIDLAKENYQSGIWLFTWIGNTRAVDFYHKAGFNIIGSHQFQVTETHYNEHYQMFLDIRN